MWILWRIVLQFYPTKAYCPCINTRDWKFERKDLQEYRSVVYKKWSKNGKASKRYYNTTYDDLQVKNIAQNCSDYKPSKLIAIQSTAAILNCIVSSSYYGMLSRQINTSPLNIQ